MESKSKSPSNRGSYISISNHRGRKDEHLKSVDSSSEEEIDSSSVKDGARPKRLTPSELMKRLKVDVKSIKEKDENFWESIENASLKEGGIKVRYTDSGQPVLKFDNNSQLATWLMVALTKVGNLSAGCELAAMIEPSARTSPLICLLQEINSSKGLLPADEDFLKSALVGSCKDIIKTSEGPLASKDVSKVDALLQLCPPHLKGHVVAAGVLALLPVGCGTIAKLLFTMPMTTEERSSAIAIAIDNARKQPNWEKQISALWKLGSKLMAKFPGNELHIELTQAIANSYKAEPLSKEMIAAYEPVKSSVDWVDAIKGIKTATANDEEKYELAIVAALKNGLTIEQLHALAFTVWELDTSDRRVLAQRLVARLLEAVPYMNPPLSAANFQSEACGHIYWKKHSELKELRETIRSFCQRDDPVLRLNYLVDAERKAHEAKLPLDFLSAIPTCLPTLKFKPAIERLAAYRNALANPRLKGVNLREAALKMGWPKNNSFPQEVVKFGDLLHEEKYEEAEEVLKDMVDPMFVDAATERLRDLKAARDLSKKSHGMKLPW